MEELLSLLVGRRLPLALGTGETQYVSFEIDGLPAVATTVPAATNAAEAGGAAADDEREEEAGGGEASDESGSEAEQRKKEKEQAQSEQQEAKQEKTERQKERQKWRQQQRQHQQLHHYHQQQRKQHEKQKQHQQRKKKQEQKRKEQDKQQQNNQEEERWHLSSRRSSSDSNGCRGSGNCQNSNKGSEHSCNSQVSSNSSNGSVSDKSWRGSLKQQPLSTQQQRQVVQRQRTQQRHQGRREIEQNQGRREIEQNMQSNGEDEEDEAAAAAKSRKAALNKRKASTKAGEREDQTSSSRPPAAAAGATPEHAAENCSREDDVSVTSRLLKYLDEYGQNRSDWTSCGPVSATEAAAAAAAGKEEAGSSGNSGARNRRKRTTSEAAAARTGKTGKRSKDSDGRRRCSSAAEIDEGRTRDERSKNSDNGEVEASPEDVARLERHIRKQQQLLRNLKEQQIPFHTSYLFMCGWKDKFTRSPHFKACLYRACVTNNLTEKGPCVCVSTFDGEYEFQCTDSRLCRLWLDTLKQLGCRLLSFSDLFKITACIGEGSFARAYVGVQQYSGKKVVIKAVSKNNIRESNVYKEIQVLRNTVHPYIVRFYVAYDSEEHVMLVLEYLPGGELFEHLRKQGPCSEEKARTAMRRLLLALQCIHNKGIVHRDIKTENLILETADDPASLKLVDFGLAASVDDPSMRMRCGSPGYVAPEIFQNVRYGTKVDVFSAGVILYTLLAGVNPFRGPNAREILRKNMRCQLDTSPPEWTSVSSRAKDLVAWMCCRSPDRRCAASQALTHPWFFSIRPPPGSRGASPCLHSATPLGQYRPAPDDDDASFDFYPFLCDDFTPSGDDLSASAGEGLSQSAGEEAPVVLSRSAAAAAAYAAAGPMPKSLEEMGVPSSIPGARRSSRSRAVDDDRLQQEAIEEYDRIMRYQQQHGGEEEEEEELQPYERYTDHGDDDEEEEEEEVEMPQQPQQGQRSADGPGKQPRKNYFRRDKIMIRQKPRVPQRKPPVSVLQRVLLRNLARQRQRCKEAKEKLRQFGVTMPWKELVNPLIQASGRAAFVKPAAAGRGRLAAAAAAACTEDVAAEPASGRCLYSGVAPKILEQEQDESEGPVFPFAGVSDDEREGARKVARVASESEEPVFPFAGVSDDEGEGALKVAGAVSESEEPVFPFAGVSDDEGEGALNVAGAASEHEEPVFPFAGVSDGEGEVALEVAGAARTETGNTGRLAGETAACNSTDIYIHHGPETAAAAAPAAAADVVAPDAVVDRDADAAPADVAPDADAVYAGVLPPGITLAAGVFIDGAAPGAGQKDPASAQRRQLQLLKNTFTPSTSGYSARAAAAAEEIVARSINPSIAKEESRTLRERGTAEIAAADSCRRFNQALLQEPLRHRNGNRLMTSAETDATSQQRQQQQRSELEKLLRANIAASQQAKQQAALQQQEQNLQPRQMQQVQQHQRKLQQQEMQQQQLQQHQLQQQQLQQQQLQQLQQQEMQQQEMQQQEMRQQLQQQEPQQEERAQRNRLGRRLQRQLEAQVLQRLVEVRQQQLQWQQQGGDEKTGIHPREVQLMRKQGVQQQPEGEREAPIYSAVQDAMQRSSILTGATPEELLNVKRHLIQREKVRQGLQEQLEHNHNQLQQQQLQQQRQLHQQQLQHQIQQQQHQLQQQQHQLQQQQHQLQQQQHQLQQQQQHDFQEHQRQLQEQWRLQRLQHLLLQVQQQQPQQLQQQWQLQQQQQQQPQKQLQQCQQQQQVQQQPLQGQQKVKEEQQPPYWSSERAGYRTSAAAPSPFLDNSRDNNTSGSSSTCGARGMLMRDMERGNSALVSEEGQEGKRAAAAAADIIAVTAATATGSVGVSERLGNTFARDTSSCAPPQHSAALLAAESTVYAPATSSPTYDESPPVSPAAAAAAQHQEDATDATAKPEMWQAPQLANSQAFDLPSFQPSTAVPLSTAANTALVQQQQACPLPVSAAATDGVTQKQKQQLQLMRRLLRQLRMEPPQQHAVNAAHDADYRTAAARAEEAATHAAVVTDPTSETAVHAALPCRSSLPGKNAVEAFSLDIPTTAAACSSAASSSACTYTAPPSAFTHVLQSSVATATATGEAFHTDAAPPSAPVELSGVDAAAAADHLAADGIATKSRGGAHRRRRRTRLFHLHTATAGWSRRSRSTRGARAASGSQPAEKPTTSRPSPAAATKRTAIRSEIAADDSRKTCKKCARKKKCMAAPAETTGRCITPVGPASAIPVIAADGSDCIRGDLLLGQQQPEEASEPSQYSVLEEKQQQNIGDEAMKAKQRLTLRGEEQEQETADSSNSWEQGQQQQQCSGAHNRTYIASRRVTISRSSGMRVVSGRRGSSASQRSRRNSKNPMVSSGYRRRSSSGRRFVLPPVIPAVRTQREKQHPDDEATYQEKQPVVPQQLSGEHHGDQQQQQDIQGGQQQMVDEGQLGNVNQEATPTLGNSFSTRSLRKEENVTNTRTAAEASVAAAGTRGAGQASGYQIATGKTAAAAGSEVCDRSASVARRTTTSETTPKRDNKASKQGPPIAAMPFSRRHHPPRGPVITAFSAAGHTYCEAKGEAQQSLQTLQQHQCTLLQQQHAEGARSLPHEESRQTDGSIRSSGDCGGVDGLCASHVIHPEMTAVASVGTSEDAAFAAASSSGECASRTCDASGAENSGRDVDTAFLAAAVDGAAAICPCSASTEGQEQCSASREEPQKHQEQHSQEGMSPASSKQTKEGMSYTKKNNSGLRSWTENARLSSEPESDHRQTSKNMLPPAIPTPRASAVWRDLDVIAAARGHRKYAGERDATAGVDCFTAGDGRQHQRQQSRNAKWRAFLTGGTEGGSRSSRSCPQQQRRKQPHWVGGGQEEEGLPLGEQLQQQDREQQQGQRQQQPRSGGTEEQPETEEEELTGRRRFSSLLSWRLPLSSRSWMSLTTATASSRSGLQQQQRQRVSASAHNTLREVASDELSPRRQRHVPTSGEGGAAAFFFSRGRRRRGTLPAIPTAASRSARSAGTEASSTGAVSHPSSLRGSLHQLRRRTGSRGSCWGRRSSREEESSDDDSQAVASQQRTDAADPAAVAAAVAATAVVATGDVGARAETLQEHQDQQTQETRPQTFEQPQPEASQNSYSAGPNEERQQQSVDAPVAAAVTHARNRNRQRGPVQHFPFASVRLQPTRLGTADEREKQQKYQQQQLEQGEWDKGHQKLCPEDEEKTRKERSPFWSFWGSGGVQQQQGQQQRLQQQQQLQQDGGELHKTEAQQSALHAAQHGERQQEEATIQQANTVQQADSQQQMHAGGEIEGQCVASPRYPGTPRHAAALFFASLLNRRRRQSSAEQNAEVKASGGGGEKRSDCAEQNAEVKAPDGGGERRSSCVSSSNSGGVRTSRRSSYNSNGSNGVSNNSSNRNSRRSSWNSRAGKPGAFQKEIYCWRPKVVAPEIDGARRNSLLSSVAASSDTSFAAVPSEAHAQRTEPTVEHHRATNDDTTKPAGRCLYMPVKTSPRSTSTAGNVAAPGVMVERTSGAKDVNQSSNSGATAGSGNIKDNHRSSSRQGGKIGELFGVGGFLQKLAAAVGGREWSSTKKTVAAVGDSAAGSFSSSSHHSSGPTESEVYHTTRRPHSKDIDVVGQPVQPRASGQQQKQQPQRRKNIFTATQRRGSDACRPQPREGEQHQSALHPRPKVQLQWRVKQGQERVTVSSNTRNGEPAVESQSYGSSRRSSISCSEAAVAVAAATGTSPSVSSATGMLPNHPSAVFLSDKTTRDPLILQRIAATTALRRTAESEEDRKRRDEELLVLLFGDDVHQGEKDSKRHNAAGPILSHCSRGSDTGDSANNSINEVNSSSSSSKPDSSIRPNSNSRRSSSRYNNRCIPSTDGMAPDQQCSIRCSGRCAVSAVAGD